MKKPNFETKPIEDFDAGPSIDKIYKGLREGRGKHFYLGATRKNIDVCNVVELKIACIEAAIDFFNVNNEYTRYFSGEDINEEVMELLSKGKFHEPGTAGMEIYASKFKNLGAVLDRELRTNDANDALIKKALHGNKLNLAKHLYNKCKDVEVEVISNFNHEKYGKVDPSGYGFKKRQAKNPNKDLPDRP